MKKSTVCSLMSSLALGLMAPLAAEAQQSTCNGGTLFTDQGNPITIIAGDGVPDPVRIFPSGVVGEKFTFVITDDQLNVLAYTTDHTVDLEGAPAGTSCYVYGLAYDGELTEETGIPVTDVAASGCTSLSRNGVIIERKPHRVDGGIMWSDRGFFPRVCLNAPLPFRVYTFNNSSANVNYQFIITDNEGNILGYPPGNTIDLSAAPPGLCLVYGVAFTGDLIQGAGTIDEVDSTDGNAEVSRNPIYARRLEQCN